MLRPALATLGLAADFVYHVSIPTFALAIAASLFLH